jgi:uncharacterized protein
MYEQRTYQAGIHLRGSGQKQKIVGHPSVFNIIGDGGWFREKIAPGAFSKSIKQDDVRALINHDKNRIIGRTTAGTLKLSEDAKGLLSEIDPPDTQYARDLMVSISRGDISQMSFGFEILKEERVKGENGEPDLFIIREAKLWDVSPVTFPFYTQTDVSLNSRLAWHDERHGHGSIPGMRLKLRRKLLNLKLSK